MAQNISVSTQILGVIGTGFPDMPGFVADEQVMYNNIFKYYSIDAEYHIFTVEPEKIPEFITAAKVLKMPAFGVTMPDKGAIVPYLDHVEEDSKIFNAVNLVVIKDGETYGYMTDGRGYAAYFDNNKIDLNGKTVTCIGAGSVTAVMLYELTKRGVSKINILNRTKENAQKIADKINENTKAVATAYELDYALLDQFAPESAVLMNTSCMGMVGSGCHFERLDFIDKLPKDAVVTDVVLTPLETDFILRAKKNGLRTSVGADMDVYQIPETVELIWPELHSDYDTVINLCSKAYNDGAMTRFLNLVWEIKNGKIYFGKGKTPDLPVKAKLLHYKYKFQMLKHTVKGFIDYLNA